MAAADSLSDGQFPHWSEQSAMVHGTSRSLGDVKGGTWWHASDNEIDPDDVIQPGRSAAKHKESPADLVSVSSNPEYARAWGKNLYEVEPHGEVTTHRAALADQGKSFEVLEARVPSAQVKRRMD